MNRVKGDHDGVSLGQRVAVMVQYGYCGDKVPAVCKGRNVQHPRLVFAVSAGACRGAAPQKGHPIPPGDGTWVFRTQVIVSGKPEFDLRVALNPIHPSFRVVVLIQKSIGSPDVNVWYCLQPAAQNRRMGEDNDRHIGSGIQKLCQGSEGFLC